MSDHVILIGEDDQGIIEVIKIILQDAGYKTVEVSDATHILSETKKHMPALILLDIWMSGENGGEIAKKIKRDPKTAHIPIIMISANNETEHIAKSVGAEGFLQKPFNMDDLIAIVEKYVKSA